jgi:hypothetical protein
MGKVFKKITKPIAKVLDKVVPNEIKPALPYLAAFAPFMLPPGFGASMFGSMSPTVSSMFARGLVGGGANALSQLSQEGNEGDLSLARVALAAAPAALSAPGAGDYFQGSQIAGNSMATGAPITQAALGGTSDLYGMTDPTLFQQAQNFGLGALEKGSNFLSGAEGSGGVSDILSPGGTPVGFNLGTAQAASVPLISGATESAIILGQQAMRDYENQYQDWQNFSGQQLANFNSGRRQAIIASMTAAQLGEDVISSTLAQLGLRDGGRVAAMNGGIMDAMRGSVQYPGGYAGEGTEYLSPTDSNQGGMGGVVYYDENGKPITKEQAMKLFNKQAKEEEKKKIKKANGGIIGLMNGGQPVEMDYRMGGMIPIGSKERADDVPARLSKNEFVMTADAVRAAGGGSVNEGARRMYELMNNLEARA